MIEAASLIRSSAVSSYNTAKQKGCWILHGSNTGLSHGGANLIQPTGSVKSQGIVRTLNG
jgi:hypothetical protein